MKIRLKGIVEFDYDIEAENLQDAKNRFYDALKQINKPNFYYIQYDDLYTEV